MSEKNVQFNEKISRGKSKNLSQESVEETLNSLFEEAAEKLSKQPATNVA